jgi:hypothetical protein
LCQCSYLEDVFDKIGIESVRNNIVVALSNLLPGCMSGQNVGGASFSFHAKNSAFLHFCQIKWDIILGISPHTFQNGRQCSRGSYTSVRVSEWLLFNANSAIVQLYQGENKSIFNEMRRRSFFVLDMSPPLGHIILIPNQPAFVIST